MKMQTIEVDEATAETLLTRAAERGMTVPELVAELAGLENEPIDIEQNQLEELDRRWRMVEDGRGTITNDEVVRWLRTWGTPAFHPWNKR